MWQCRTLLYGQLGTSKPLTGTVHKSILNAEGLVHLGGSLAPRCPQWRRRRSLAGGCWSPLLQPAASGPPKTAPPQGTRLESHMPFLYHLSFLWDVHAEQGHLNLHQPPETQQMCGENVLIPFKYLRSRRKLTKRHRWLLTLGNTLNYFNISLQVNIRLLIPHKTL